MLWRKWETVALSTTVRHTAASYKLGCAGAPEKWADQIISAKSSLTHKGQHLNRSKLFDFKINNTPISGWEVGL